MGAVRIKADDLLLEKILKIVLTFASIFLT